MIKSHCKRGHPRTPENLFRNGSCKQCSAAMTKEWQQNHPEKVKAYNVEHQRRKKGNPERGASLLAYESIRDFY